MKPTIFDNTVATEVENAVMSVFGCERHDIVQFRDSEVKKVVVFFLYHHFDWNWHVVGVNYKMTYLYVPTVAEEILYKIKTDPLTKSKIDRIKSMICNLKIAV